MVCSVPELSLDLSPPSSFPEFLSDFPTAHVDDSCEFLKLVDFVDELEAEIKKIQAFQRELPLSFTLLNHAIEKLREKVKKCEQKGGKQGKLGESVGVKSGINNNNNNNSDVVEKKDWMSSVQLWAPSNEEEGRGRKAEGGVISSFKEDEKAPRLSLVTPSVVDQSCKVFRTGGESQGLVNQTEKLQPKQACQVGSRKQRRCWSPELHRRFLDALEKLGGSQVATPKQIRELMQVDGLTNDEVKSHLQKYRLHIRKPPTRATASSSKTPPSVDQVMGGDTLELGYSNSDIQHSCSLGGLSHYVMSKKCNSYSINGDEEENSDGHTSKAQRVF